MSWDLPPPVWSSTLISAVFCISPACLGPILSFHFLHLFGMSSSLAFMSSLYSFSLFRTFCTLLALWRSLDVDFRSWYVRCGSNGDPAFFHTWSAFLHCFCNALISSFQGTAFLLGMTKSRHYIDWFTWLIVGLEGPSFSFKEIKCFTSVSLIGWEDTLLC